MASFLRRAVTRPAAWARPFTSSAALSQKAAAAKKGAAPAAAAVEEKYDLTKQIPVNIMKEGGEPEYRPDSEYPDWLWKLLEDKPVMEDVMMQGLEKMSSKTMRTVVRVASKKGIKDRNATSAKAGEE